MSYRPLTYVQKMRGIGYRPRLLDLDSDDRWRMPPSPVVARFDGYQDIDGTWFYTPISRPYKTPRCL